MLQPVALAHKSLADYTHIVGRPLVEEIRELAEPLKGTRVVQLSATAFGGGVSEILYTLIPLMRDVGLEVEWQVIYGREEFFNSTKLMHNALQGAPQDLTEEQWATWFQYNEMNARELSRGWDVCLVHDPQPAAMLSLEDATFVCKQFGIDTSRPMMCQVSRFDPWKDPLGVIDAYRIVKEERADVQLALVGSMASDDPEGWDFYNSTLAHA
ncbi:MAG: trehalose synthase, partial [Solirubrobacteraceae bacterium]|nr:trehalose synthase [Solirubrobacteraceae bacterium]